MSFNMVGALEKRAKLIEDSRAVLNKVDAEKRAISAEEKAQIEAMDAEIDALGDRIELEQRQEKREKMLSSSPAVGGKLPGNTAAKKAGDDLSVRAFREYLKHGESRMSPELRTGLHVGDNPAGGYLVPSEVMESGFIATINDALMFRNYASKFSVPNTGTSLGVMTVDTGLSDGEWTTELATGTLDTGITFGKRALKPNDLWKGVKVSAQLLRGAVINVEQYVLGEIARVIAVAQEKGFITGDGVEKPLGLFTASADGIPTSRDVSTDNTTTAITFDGLIEAKYSVKAEYWQKCAWMFHPDAVKKLRKIKDTTNQYIWEQSVRAGEPDTILGHTVLTSRFVPSTFTTGLYVGMFGDFSYYYIVDSMQMEVQKLVELFATENRIGYFARSGCDGAPVKAEAFARIKLA